MADVIAPQKTVTFTVTSVPKRVPQLKTIERLMRMQPEIQVGLKKLARRRRQRDNIATNRAGRTWISRARASRLTRVEPGETFTLTLTPQIIPDVRSVQRFLKAKKSG